MAYTRADIVSQWLSGLSQEKECRVYLFLRNVIDDFRLWTLETAPYGIRPTPIVRQQSVFVRLTPPFSDLNR